MTEETVDQEAVDRAVNEALNQAAIQKAVKRRLNGAVNKRRRIWSFIVGGAIAVLAIVLGCINTEHIGFFLGAAVTGFTLSSCMILHNNFVIDMMVDIMTWSFGTLPVMIFDMDLDGLIMMLTVKLVLWILGGLLAIALALLAIVIGAVVSVFVYPYAIVKNIRGGDYEEYM